MILNRPAVACALQGSLCARHPVETVTNGQYRDSRGPGPVLISHRSFQMPSTTAELHFRKDSSPSLIPKSIRDRSDQKLTDLAISYAVSLRDKLLPGEIDF